MPITSEVSPSLCAPSPPTAASAPRAPRGLELSLTAADGISLAARLRPVAVPRGAVVVAHGMSASMDDGAVATTAEPR